MFREMKVKEVKFNEVDVIAGGAFLETFARNNQGSLGVKEVDGEFYVVKQGKSMKITANTIAVMVKKDIIGKTLSEIESNSKLLLLVQELNLIDEITFENVEEEIDLGLF